ncbi:hypothetical protein POVWA2_017980 [Plasmodium ovale wallikeri]|uniref:Uncharacterized protein n=1 Tax=Plasmodium ovale wallikeri TaxID=864142 RepID=A0A1A8YPV7_PLAOA|nr:hypothetical protein POVWA1_018090 [Plasmodium ovale wallikeri]SBT34060.1 hypothetical protein POVWA2_017980 [Plasmodium ovale wallikeri]
MDDMDMANVTCKRNCSAQELLQLIPGQSRAGVSRVRIYCLGLPFGELPKGHLTAEGIIPILREARGKT